MVGSWETWAAVLLVLIVGMCLVLVGAVKAFRAEGVGSRFFGPAARPWTLFGTALIVLSAAVTVLAFVLAA